MTYLASSWRLWKLQFSADAAWWIRVPLFGFALFLLFANPVIQPGWSSIFAPGFAVTILWSCIAPAEREYRAFGMNRRRAAAHQALTVVPLVALAAAATLSVRADMYGVAGAAVSVATGAILISMSNPARETNDTSGGGTTARLRGLGGFAARVLWRPVLLGSAAAGAMAGAAELAAFALARPGLHNTLHGMAYFLFILWLATRLGRTGTAWGAFGIDQRHRVRHVMVAAVAAPLLMNAVCALVLAGVGLLGWAPASLYESNVGAVLAISIIPAAAIAVLAGSLGAEDGARFWAVFLGMFAWFMFRDAVDPEVSLGSYLTSAAVFGVVLGLFSAYNIYATLRGERPLRRKDNPQNV